MKENGTKRKKRKGDRIPFSGIYVFFGFLAFFKGNLNKNMEFRLFFRIFRYFPNTKADTITIAYLNTEIL